MLRWMRLRRERMEQINSEAVALVETLGVAAYSAARRRECEASTYAAARHWRHVALAIARKSGKRVGLDAATRGARDADLPERGEAATSKRDPKPEVGPLVELLRIVGEPQEPPRRAKVLTFPRRRRRPKGRR